MASEKIMFHCPACGMQLSVPTALAGIEGPCPTCSATIRAPLLTQLPAADPGAAAPEAPPSRPPLPAMPQFQDIPSGPRIRPAPRELPERPVEVRAAPISARKTTDDEELRRQPVRRTRRSYGPRPIMRLMVPVVFVGAVVLLVLFVIRISKPGKAYKPLRSDDNDTSEVQQAGPAPIKPATTHSPSAAPANKNPQSALSDSPAGNPPISGLAGGDDPTLPDLTVPAIPAAPSSAASEALAAERVLEDFIKAKDAATRAPLCDPVCTAESLAGTVLAGRLPEIEELYPEPARVTDYFVEYPFIATLLTESGKVDYTILVRKRPNEAPRVFTPPVLDLLGGRLAKFAKTPGKDIGTFYVVLYPLPRCYEDTVPDAKNKNTLKFLPSPLSGGIASAYFSNSSRFKKMFDELDSPVRWAQKVRATVTLQWNRTEDPSQPFLEVSDIKALNWGP